MQLMGFSGDPRLLESLDLEKSIVHLRPCLVEIKIIIPSVQAEEVPFFYRYRTYPSKVTDQPKVHSIRVLLCCVF